MGKVIGALVGLIAAVVYAVAAAELLAAETGVDMLARLRGTLPDDLIAWIERAPLEAAESAPAWRHVVMGLAVGAGALGSLLLIAGSRLSATLLWLAFMLLAGVLVGRDLVLADGIASAQARDLIALAGALGLSLAFAAIANVATAPAREPEGADGELHERAEHVRELLRAPAPPPPSRRAAEPEPPIVEASPPPLLPADDLDAPEPEPDVSPAGRAAESERAREDSAPASAPDAEPDGAADEKGAAPELERAEAPAASGVTPLRKPAPAETAEVGEGARSRDDDIISRDEKV